LLTDCIYEIQKSLPDSTGCTSQNVLKQKSSIGRTANDSWRG